MHADEPFGSWSLAAAGATVMLAQTFHPILFAVLRAGETAAWLAILVAGLLAIAMYWPVAAGIASLPGGNLIDLARAAMGAPGAIAAGVLVCSLLLYHSGMIIRQTSEMAISAVYTHTPQTFAMVTLVACVLYGAYGGLAALVRLSRLFLPFLVLAILLNLVGSLGWGEFRNLLPLWGPGPAALLGRSAGLTALYSPLVLFLLIAAGQLRDRVHLGRAGTVTMGGVRLLLAAATFVLLMTYPLPMGFSITFPLHAMSRLVLGGRFFDRIEGDWMFFWVYGTACHLAALLYAAAAAYAGAFGMPNHRAAVLPLIAMAIAIALFPPDQARAVAWHAAATPFGLGIGFAMPLFLALLAAWRGRWKGRGI